MTTEFPLEWDGFTADEKRQLKPRWARLRFPAEFCARFSGKICKGTPGQPSDISISANDIRTFREHWSAKFDFSSLDELVKMAGDGVTKAAQKWREMTGSREEVQ